MFYHLLESSLRDDSNKWSSIGFDEEITQVGSIERSFTRIIWISVMNDEQKRKKSTRSLEIRTYSIILSRN